MAAGDDTPLTDAEADELLAPLAKHPALVLAVSGGADSTALMYLVHGWSRRAGRLLDNVIVATVDHGLRPEAAAEAETVGRLAASLGLRHRTLGWEGPKPASGIQAAAREARYGLLAAAAREAAGVGKYGVIVTAHTADDQAETLIMRLARGSGVDGLASIPPVGTLRGAIGDRDCFVHRPLLAVPRSRLVATLRAAGIAFIDDPSNSDRRFERVRVREALAVLEQLGLTREAIARTASRMQAAREALNDAASHLRGDATHASWMAGSVLWSMVDEFDAETLLGAPAETGARVLRHSIRKFGGNPELSAIEAAYQKLLAAHPSAVTFTLGGCLIELVGARDSRGMVVRIYREPDRGLPTVRVEPGQQILWDKRFWVYLWEGHPTPVEVGPLGDDWIKLKGRYDFLAGASIPDAVARGIPAVRKSGELVAVPWLLGVHPAASSTFGGPRHGIPGEPGRPEGGYVDVQISLAQPDLKDYDALL